MQTTITIWTVLAAAAVNMIVGFIWYGPLFGKMWKKLMGFTDVHMKSMRLSVAQAILLGCVTAVAMSYVLGHFVVFEGVTDVGRAWELAFWLWLGFFATTTAGSFIWEGKPFKLFLLNTAEQLVALFLMTLVFALWR